MIVLMWLVTVGAQAGKFGNSNPSGIPGQWYIGTTPSYVDPTKAPLVFVHGLNSASDTWWEGNNMYDTAYANGYRTAFIDLYPTKNMWDNGALLSQKIREIYDYFGKQKLVLVTHSKGGIDAQSALVHHNAHPYVSNVITLSTPHYGSQLADLAYSNWAGWLAGILGSKNDATYSLQTGYMKNFRTQTDTHASSRKNPFYTFGGTSWGSFGSSLYWGGLYLRGYGQNDGAVTVTNSRLPYGKEVKVSSWNHTTIKEGSSTFSLFKPYLKSTATTLSNFAMTNEAQTTADAASFYYRGGEYSGTTREEFVVEDNVDAIVVDWMSSSPNSKLAVLTPNNQTLQSFQTTVDTGIFAGAYHHQLHIKDPKIGTWKIEAKNSVKEAYLLNISYESQANDAINIEKISKTNKALKFNSNNKKINKDSLEATINVDYLPKNKKAGKKLKLKKEKNAPSVPVNIQEEGSYTITIDVKGKTVQGHKFERTIIKSVYVDSNGEVFQ
ncbi:esterase/lipase family protein [Metabacillus herbersteinensis]|uniref:Esterase/lipase family protein n=1 Tax=Metabacillus herbersteinensis TaxID=283816 RepID=A0ABV6GBD9_9BACI